MDLWPISLWSIGIPSWPIRSGIFHLHPSDIIRLGRPPRGNMAISKFTSSTLEASDKRYCKKLTWVVFGDSCERSTSSERSFALAPTILCRDKTSRDLAWVCFGSTIFFSQWHLSRLRFWTYAAILSRRHMFLESNESKCKARLPQLRVVFKDALILLNLHEITV